MKYSDKIITDETTGLGLACHVSDASGDITRDVSVLLFNSFSFSFNFMGTNITCLQLNMNHVNIVQSIWF